MSYKVPFTPVGHYDLEQLKRQAKELLKALDAGDPSALELARRRDRGARPARFQLVDAQRIIARHHGFESWARLRAQVDAANLKRLVAAVRAGNLAEAGRLLKRRPELLNCDMAENDEHRVIHFAVLQRDEPMVRLLVKGGADARKGIYPHREATTAHALATERDFSELVAAIEEEEALRSRKAKGSDGSELFDALRQSDFASALALLKGDASLATASDRDGNTALHIACEIGALPVIDLLLERGADCSQRNLRGWTPLERAILTIPSEKKAERVALFSATARRLIGQGAEIRPLVAAALGEVEALRDWHRRRPESLTSDHLWGQSCGVMGAAVLFGQRNALEALLDLGLDPDEPQRLADLEEPVMSRGGPLSGAIAFGEEAMALLLLERGADPGACVYASGTPMDRAYRARDERMKALLKRFDARPSAATIGAHREVAEARELLANAPSDVTVAELLRAAACGGSPEIVRSCLERIDWPPLDPRWPLAEPLRVWNHSPLNPFPEGFDRSTYPECLRLLLAGGASPNRPGKFGDTLMHNIAALGKVWGVEVMTPEERLRFAEVALEFHPDLTLRDGLLRSTPLGWACRWGRGGLVRLLVERGASAHEPDAEPWASPLAWAEKRGWEEIALYLRAHGAR